MTGWKTYAVCLSAILSLWVAYFVDRQAMPLSTAIEGTFAALAAAGIRHGITTEAAKRALFVFLIVGVGLFSGGCLTLSTTSQEQAGIAAYEFQDDATANVRAALAEYHGDWQSYTVKQRAAVTWDFKAAVKSKPAVEAAVEAAANEFVSKQDRLTVSQLNEQERFSRANGYLDTASEINGELRARAEDRLKLSDEAKAYMLRLKGKLTNGQSATIGGTGGAGPAAAGGGQ